MRIRFQADADLNQIIVAAVLRRIPEADFRTASDARLAGLHDLEVLAIATDSKGKAFPTDRATVELNMKPDTAKRVTATGFRVIQSLELAPGRYNLRVAARNAARHVTQRQQRRALRAGAFFRPRQVCARGHVADDELVRERINWHAGHLVN